MLKMKNISNNLKEANAVANKSEKGFEGVTGQPLNTWITVKMTYRQEPFL